MDETKMFQRSYYMTNNWDYLQQLTGIIDRYFLGMQKMLFKVGILMTKYKNTDLGNQVTPSQHQPCLENFSVPTCIQQIKRVKTVVTDRVFYVESKCIAKHFTTKIHYK